LASDDDGRSVLKGSVLLDYRTTDRFVILTLPGQAQYLCRARPSTSSSCGSRLTQVTPISSDRGIWPIE